MVHPYFLMNLFSCFFLEEKMIFFILAKKKTQNAMVVLAGLSLPWMLFKPIVELIIHKRQVKKKAEPTIVTVVNIDENDDNQKIESSSSASLEDEEEKVEMVVYKVRESKVWRG